MNIDARRLHNINVRDTKARATSLSRVLNLRPTVVNAVRDRRIQRTGTRARTRTRVCVRKEKKKRRNENIATRVRLYARVDAFRIIVYVHIYIQDDSFFNRELEEYK